MSSNWLRLHKAKRIFPGFEFVKELRGGPHKANFCVRNFGEDEGDEELLCLKVIHQNSSQNERFQREIDILSKLEPHPNLAQLVTENEMTYRGGKFHYFCETYIEGTDLEDKLESKPWSLARACLFMAQVCDGLRALEEAKVVHRDLKPTNIRVTLEDKPVLIDLGIAKAIDLPGLTKASESQPGTPAYLSPEQAQDSSDSICSATDLHAVGIILYRLLTGHHPFYKEGMSSEDVSLRIISSTDFKELKEFRQLKPEARDLLSSLLEKSPASRPKSAQIVAKRLRHLVSENTESLKGNFLDFGVHVSTLITAISVLLSSIDEDSLIEFATDEQSKVKLKALVDLVKAMPSLPDDEDPFLAITRSGAAFILALNENEEFQVRCPIELSAMLLIGSCWQNLNEDTLSSIEWPKQELCCLALQLGKDHIPRESFHRPPLKQVLKDAVNALPEHHSEWSMPVVAKAFCAGLDLEPDLLFKPEVMSALAILGKNIKVDLEKSKDKPNRYLVKTSSNTSIEVSPRLKSETSETEG